MSDLNDIARRCERLSNSPYMMKEPPPELKNLRELLQEARSLSRQDVPALIAEIKRLRIQGKRLEAETNDLRSTEQH